MSDLSIFDNKIEENGIKYYIIPESYPLFKAKKITNNKDINIELIDGHAYFFGLKNMTDEYLKSYEEEYGVIFEYKTKMQIKLLALDDKQTQKNLYDNAPNEIKTILENNYGYYNNIRNSMPEPDKNLGRYLCSLGFQGYGIFKMKTDLGGTFHPELLICNANSFVELVGKITPDNRIESIIERSKLDKLNREMKEKKKGKRNYMNSDIPKSRLFEDNFVSRSNLFGDDELSGGKRKRKTKKQKRSKKIKKNKRKTRTRTIKRK
jgi:hypothetical protein